MTEPRNRGSPRLCFSKEELEDPELAQKAEKAEQTANRYDAAKKKLQTRRLKLTAEEVQTEQNAMQQIEADAAELHEPASPSGESSQQKKQASKVVRSSADSKFSGKAPAFVSSVTQATAEAVDASSPHARKKKIHLRFEETEAKPPSRLRHTKRHALRRLMRTTPVPLLSRQCTMLSRRWASPAATFWKKPFRL